LAIFIVNEARVKNPMVPLRLFRNRNFAGANVLTLLVYAAMSGTFFFFTLNLIQIQRYSATAAGAALLPFVILMFSLSRWSGGLIDRFGGGSARPRHGAHRRAFNDDRDERCW
jgi:predicted MFS family arabinose efflux permease